MVSWPAAGDNRRPPRTYRRRDLPSRQASGQPPMPASRTQTIARTQIFRSLPTAAPGGRRGSAVEVGEVPRGEANVERGPVLAHMRRPGCFWDRADAVLAEHRGQRHLRRGHAFVPRRAGAVCSTASGRPKRATRRQHCRAGSSYRAEPADRLRSCASS
jgi:hypothetical protein